MKDLPENSDRCESKSHLYLSTGGHLPINTLISIISFSHFENSTNIFPLIWSQEQYQFFRSFLTYASSFILIVIHVYQFFLQKK